MEQQQRPALGNLQEDEKLKEMIYSIYNYVSAQKERDGGEGARFFHSLKKSFQRFDWADSANLMQ